MPRTTQEIAIEIGQQREILHVHHTSTGCRCSARKPLEDSTLAIGVIKADALAGKRFAKGNAARVEVIGVAR
jgi:hypothetical protein